MRQNLKKYLSSKQITTILILTTLIISTLTPSITALDSNKSQESYKIIEDQLNGSIHYSYLFQKPELQEVTLIDESFTKLILPGTLAVSTKSGNPAIPLSLARFVLPPNTQIKKIDVTGQPIPLNTQINLIEKPIVPYQQSIPIGQQRSTTLTINNELYDSDTMYPQQIFQNLGVDFSRGYPISTVSLTPIQYNPVQGVLWYYEQLTVTIELEKSTNINKFFRNNPTDEAWVIEMVDNPEIIELYKQGSIIQSTSFEYPGGLCDPSEDFDYVIITTTHNGLDDWQTTSSLPYNWTSLMDKHTIDDALDCTLVTIQEINACSDYFNATSLFNDTQAHIREFCRDAYSDWETEYIFVGGDDEWIPARHMDSNVEYDVDSDIYWSNLDNNFNADSDNYWGEEADMGFDLYAELFIGRITCDEPQDVSNWMKKSLYYADATDKDYLENAGFYAGDTGWNCQGDDFMDYSAIKGTNDWLGPNPHADGPYPTWLGFNYGFETWNSNNYGMEYNLSVAWTAEPPNPGWLGGSESAAITGFKNAINNDCVTIISAIAHANAQMSMDVFASSWESDYHNTKPFFVHDYGCHCGDMDAADDGVLHSMLFHDDEELAFGCVFNTGYGWGNFDTTNSSSALQTKLFWDYLFDTTNNSGNTQDWQLGKAIAWSKDMMAPTINWDGTWRSVIQGCLLFADPAQLIKPPVKPDHNIGIKEFDVDSHEPADTDIWINTTLFNNGQHDETNIEVKFLVDDVLENTTIIPLFNEDTMQTVSWIYHTPAYGWETLCINVTPVPGENITSDNNVYKDVIYGPDIAVTQINAPKYVGIGFAQSVKGYIENLGKTDETVEIQLFANNSLQNSTNIYLTSETATWVSFMWDGTQSGVGTYDVIIHAVPVPNEYYIKNQNRSATVSVFHALGSILLVDDDSGDNYQTWYEDALIEANFVYTIWDHSTQSSPSSTEMHKYSAVVWLTGDSMYGTIDATDQYNLQNYLDTNGRIFISGQDIGYDIGYSTFYQNYLHANYLVDYAGVNIEGVDDDPIGDDLTFSIMGGDGANNQYYPDGISPRSPATTSLYYASNPNYKAGIKVDTGTYKVVYFGFGFEGIDNQIDRTTIMTRILSFLVGNITDTEPPTTTLSIYGQIGENDWYTSALTVKLDAHDMHSGVKTTKYRIDNSDWMEYEGIFGYYTEGSHTIDYYSIDHAGNIEDMQSSEFKLDRNPPTISLSKTKLGVNEMKFTATVTDNISGVNRVEFYLDDELVETVTSAPYEWIWQGTGTHEVYAIAYDNAGNDEESNTLNTPVSTPTIPSSPIPTSIQKLLISLQPV